MWGEWEQHKHTALYNFQSAESFIEVAWPAAHCDSEALLYFLYSHKHTFLQHASIFPTVWKYSLKIASNLKPLSGYINSGYIHLDS